MTEQDSRDFAAALGAEIASWRKRRKLSRGDLGALVDLSETTIGRIERGNVAAAAATADVWRISAALGLTFSDLVRRAEEAINLSGPRENLGAVASTEAGDFEPGDLED
ncbi:helix-turn-helix domain-containing protein [Pimelobacter simplex]|uniref:Uncharacterized protein n=1 Tax=Nocardioides simplex TaxID=2045 RepID=A0A0A1DKA2_NOCSI|nr:helix-turn-helix transcriptional regulator [Pimelobacter simplex]AIY15805.1 hypothetical protein KR76_01730 [Pimelobacter simplex]MCG8150352.1 helix-turn-helix domain-containing protein [Pimelobacter simplex]GEB16719.1 hypothetical protein NSI01_50340 [Pimelobacter simplex]SFM89535.1 DNA-binding transcriptional regulator, XRE-family HTH domain [Pimelobacter simplex]